MKKFKNGLIVSVGLLILFVLWTIAVIYIDVKPIGPKSSAVGLAVINKYIHNLTGVHFTLYSITDWLGLIPFFIVIVFGLIGLIQWIKRKSILKVDFDILLLGAFYIVTFAVYILFEYVVINRRPVLINGILEASYPSSTTMLVLCVIPTTIMQINSRLKNKFIKYFLFVILSSFMIFMVVGRLISGVHWFSDIIGGILFSCGLVTLYHTINTFYTEQKIQFSE